MMRVIEEPFMTREAVLAVLRPGEMTSGRPFRTLRERGAASEGLAVPIRTPGGQVLGRVQLYSSLNTDAARAYRLRRIGEARELAERATSIEQSSPAQLIRKAVFSVAASLSGDRLSVQSPSLERYVRMRGHSTWRGPDREWLTREWLLHSDAWLTGSASRDVLVEAAMELDRAVCQARKDVLGEDSASPTTFYGVVRRMDGVAAEIEGAAAGRVLLIPRDDLERQGLAVLGQPVAVLREVLPGGGSYSLPMPAVALEEESFAE